MNWQKRMKLLYILTDMNPIFRILLIEETFKERVVQVLKKSYADYASWMNTVTYKVE